MTVLITFNNKHGKRYCDAKCHNAKGNKCNCICGGRFHGKGIDQARKELTDKVREEIKKFNKDGFISFEKIQTNIFDHIKQANIIKK